MLTYLRRKNSDRIVTGRRPLSPRRSTCRTTVASANLPRHLNLRQAAARENRGLSVALADTGLDCAVRAHAVNLSPRKVEMVPDMAKRASPKLSREVALGMLWARKLRK